MPRPKSVSDDSETDDESDDEAEDDSESASDVAEEDTDAAASAAPSRGSWRERMRRRARGHGGMGRRSTGPAPRPSEPPAAPEGPPVTTAPDTETELAPDISQWPGTAEAAKTVGRHTSTIKLWRAQGRIRAFQDASGCWRHHPDDLAEAIDTPDQTDPGSVLAQGMTAIVQQGSNANDRLLTMTEIATTGLQTAAGVLSTELERAYAKIADLEQKLSEANEKLAATRELDLKHERYMRRLDHKHELDVAGARETSERVGALLTVLGPIAASVAMRLVGKVAEAEALERAAAGVSEERPISRAASSPLASTPSASPSAAPNLSSPLSPLAPKDDRLVPIETRITDAMSRLCIAIRGLDGPAFHGLRAMMPAGVQAALDDIMNGTNDSAVGQALAVLIGAAQNLSDLQFKALRPIAPADIAAILAELRELIAVKKDSPS